MKNHKKIFIGSILLALFPILLLAQVMQSDHYRIRSDSINVGGGFSSSSVYFLEDTTGEVGSGTSSSAHYNLSAGYQALQSTYLSISNVNDITMPAIGGVTGGVSDAEATWNVITDDPA